MGKARGKAICLQRGSGTLDLILCFAITFVAGSQGTSCQRIYVRGPYGSWAWRVGGWEGGVWCVCSYAEKEVVES